MNNDTSSDYKRLRPDVSIRNKTKKRPGIGKNIWLRFSNESIHAKMKSIFEGVVIDQKILAAVREIINESE